MFLCVLGPFSSMQVLDSRRINAFYRRNLAMPKGFVSCIRPSTHRGYELITSVVGDVGKAGVSICSIENMKVLFDVFH